MNQISKISIMGLGGVGSAYASRLHDINPKGVRVIAGGERATRYKEKGMLINGKRYDFNYYAPEQKCDPADLIIVAVKSYNLTQAIEDMKNHVGEHTILLSLLNGITSEEILGNAFGMEKILHGFCIGIDAVHEGNVIRYAQTGKVKFGEKENYELSQKVIAVKEVFDKAGIPYEIPENMLREQWWKFMVNVGINQASAVLKADYKVFWEVEEARSLMESAMWEVVILSQKLGIGLNEGDIKKWYDVFYTLEAGGKTSMLQDVEAGKKTEIELFAGAVCQLGRENHVDTPVNSILLNIISAMEKMAK